jgi:GAF domain-containing protein
MRRGPKSAKSKGESKPPIARKSPKNEDSRVRDLEKRLAEALEQQAATSEVLKIISRSGLDLTSMLKTVAETATRLCGAQHGHIFQFDGEMLRFAAGYGTSPELRKYFDAHPVPLGPGSASGLAAAERRTVQIADIHALPGYQFGQAASLEGWRTVLAVPMVKDRALLGTMTIWRTEVQSFNDRQIALVETFADQAVIAIENVRLFKELQARNRDLAGTSDILQVIARSPTDMQPVFNAIAESAMRLCDANFCNVVRYDGELLHLAGHARITTDAVDAMGRIFPMPPSRATVVGRVVLQSAVVHLPDVQADPEFAHTIGLAFRGRSALGVPMLRDNALLGVIAVGRAEPGPFSDSLIALLKTFADQAVIAIENVRLFTELEGKNKALTEAHAQVTEALEQQTATAEILRVISRSPTDVQPVFDAIVDSAVRLCDGAWADAYRFDGERQHFVACSNLPPEGRALLQRLYPRAPDPQAVTGRAILDRAVIHVPDAHHDPRFAITRHVSSTVGRASRSVLAVPMLHHGDAVGVILVHRGEQPRPFSSAEIDLLKTFANQAVIAIENVRLFKELQTSNRELTTALDKQTATSEILRVISQSTTDVQPRSTRSCRARCACYAGT